MGFCSIADVQAKAPRLIANLPNNIQTADIQKWIDGRAGLIYAKLLQRGIDTGWSGSKLSSMGLTSDQASAATAWLYELNLSGAIADVLDVVESMNTFQAGEVSQAAAKNKQFIKVLDEIGAGKWDALFSNPSRIQGFAGAELPATVTGAQKATFSAFSRGDRF